MPTASDLITAGAKKIGAIADGEALTAQEASDGLGTLNSLLDFLAIRRIAVYHVKQESLTWPAATASRTIGSGGNFNTTRPERIVAGTYFSDGSTHYPVGDITEDRAVYDRIQNKTASGTYPELLFYDKAYPLGILYVYPVPSAQRTLKLNSWQQLQSFSALTTDLSLPMGYRWLLEHLLGVHLGPVLQVPVPDAVRREANRALAAIAAMNAPDVLADLELPLITGGRSDIYAGE